MTVFNSERSKSDYWYLEKSTWPLYQGTATDKIMVSVPEHKQRSYLKNCDRLVSEVQVPCYQPAGMEGFCYHRQGQKRFTYQVPIKKKKKSGSIW